MPLETFLESHYFRRDEDVELLDFFSTKFKIVYGISSFAVTKVQITAKHLSQELI